MLAKAQGYAVRLIRGGRFAKSVRILSGLVPKVCYVQNYEQKYFFRPSVFAQYRWFIPFGGVKVQDLTIFERLRGPFPSIRKIGKKYFVHVFGRSTL